MAALPSDCDGSRDEMAAACLRTRGVFDAGVFQEEVCVMESGWVGNCVCVEGRRRGGGRPRTPGAGFWRIRQIGSGAGGSRPVQENGIDVILGGRRATM